MNSKGDGDGTTHSIIVGDQLLLLAYRGHFLYGRVEALQNCGRGVARKSPVRIRTLISYMR
jgi:hypothetical protein